MPNSPPTVSPPPTRFELADKAGFATPVFRVWFEQMHKRVGDASGKPIIGDLAAFEATVHDGALASGGSIALLSVNSGERWKVREIYLAGSGSDFSGGDRDLDITDGSTVWTTIAAATLQSLSVKRWGDTGMPFPNLVSEFTAESTAGANIVAQYSGGSNDYTAGATVVVLIAERTA